MTTFDNPDEPELDNKENENENDEEIDDAPVSKTTKQTIKEDVNGVACTVTLLQNPAYRSTLQIVPNIEVTKAAVKEGMKSFAAILNNLPKKERFKKQAVKRAPAMIPPFLFQPKQYFKSCFMVIVGAPWVGIGLDRMGDSVFSAYSVMIDGAKNKKVKIGRFEYDISQIYTNADMLFTAEKINEMVGAADKATFEKLNGVHTLFNRSALVFKKTTGYTAEKAAYMRGEIQKWAQSNPGKKTGLYMYKLGLM